MQHIKNAAFRVFHPDKARRADMRAGHGPTQGLLPGLPPATPIINNPATPHVPVPPPRRGAAALAPVITDKSFKVGGIHLEIDFPHNPFATSIVSSLLPATKNITDIDLAHVENDASRGAIQRLMYRLMGEKREVKCHGALVKGIRRGKVKLSMATVLLLTAYARNHAAFLRLLGGAPAPALTELLTLNAEFVTKAGLESFLPDLIDQIAYDEKRSFGSERALTNSGAIVIRKILESDGFKPSDIEAQVTAVQNKFTFNERQAAIFLGIIFGGVFKLIDQSSDDHMSRVKKAKIAVDTVLSVLNLFKPFVDFLGPIIVGADAMFDRLKDKDVNTDLRDAVNDLILDAVTYPMLKCDRIRIVGSKDDAGRDVYVPEEDGKYTFLAWFEASIRSCGFGRPAPEKKG